MSASAACSAWACLDCTTRSDTRVNMHGEALRHQAGAPSHMRVYAQERVVSNEARRVRTGGTAQRSCLTGLRYLDAFEHGPIAAVLLVPADASVIDKRADAFGKH